MGFGPQCKCTVGENSFQMINSVFNYTLHWISISFRFFSYNSSPLHNPYLVKPLITYSFHSRSELKMQLKLQFEDAK